MKLRPTFYNLSRFSFIKSRTLDSDESESGRSSNGFVALISAIIIASILLIFVVGTGAGGFYTRFDVFGSEIKEISYGLAEGCAHTAILEISQGKGDNEIFIDGNPCEVFATSTTHADVQVIYQNAYTNLHVEFDPGDFSITDWQEVAEF